VVHGGAPFALHNVPITVRYLEDQQYLVEVIDQGGVDRG
jgi:hypothetical protein